MGARANIIIDQGADFSTSLTVKKDDGTATNLTGYTAAGQIRKHYASANATAAFTIVFDVDPTTGILAIELSKTVTNAIEAGRYVYDVELTSSGDKTTRLVEGIATVTPQVTK